MHAFYNGTSPDLSFRYATYASRALVVHVLAAKKELLDAFAFGDKKREKDSLSSEYIADNTAFRNPSSSTLRSDLRKIASEFHDCSRDEQLKLKKIQLTLHPRSLLSEASRRALC
jgi:hypothetical protein